MFRFLLSVILLGLLAFFVWTYLGKPGSTQSAGSQAPAPATEGPLDPAKARQAGAEIGEKTARAANQVANTVSEAATSAAKKVKREASELGTKAEEKSAEAQARGAEGAAKAEDVISDATITAKIKSKMALDDLVKARSINVDTESGVVTLRGDVRSEKERDRAVQIARETAGVRQIVDRLQVR